MKDKNRRAKGKISSTNKKTIKRIEIFFMMHFLT